MSFLFYETVCFQRAPFFNNSLITVLAIFKFTGFVIHLFSLVQECFVFVVSWLLSFLGRVRRVVFAVPAVRKSFLLVFVNFSISNLRRFVPRRGLVIEL